MQRNVKTTQLRWMRARDAHRLRVLAMAPPMSVGEAMVSGRQYVEQLSAELFAEAARQYGGVSAGTVRIVRR